jgi:hypothetical protein
MDLAVSRLVKPDFTHVDLYLMVATKGDNRD